MYRRILVPIDGSKTSMIGLTHAIGLAKDQKARLRVLNVVDELVIAPMMMEPSAGADFTYLVESLKNEGRKALKDAAAAARKRGLKADIVQIESRGHPVSEVILAEISRSRADVIVMGTHGRRGLNRLLLGSDAERVLREATVPVLLVRGAAQPPKKRAVRRKAASRRT